MKAFLKFMMPNSAVIGDAYEIPVQIINNRETEQSFVVNMKQFLSPVALFELNQSRTIKIAPNQIG
jgi:hypothetical protein